jgi:sugar lactone lactonase YvrE
MTGGQRRSISYAAGVCASRATLRRLPVVALLAAVVGLAISMPWATTATASTLTLENLAPTVQYMIDQSQTVLGRIQFDQPRNNRGLAISPDGRYLYAGYNNPSNGYEVRKIDLLEPDYNDATKANLVSVSRGKAIDVDDQGRVYMADGNSIKIYDADLSAPQHAIVVSKGEGLATSREGGVLYLYASDRDTGQLTKYELAESGGAITGSALATSWGNGGMVDVNTASGDLRGVGVDRSGRIWIADDTNGVYVVEADGSASQQISSISNAMDVGFDDDIAYVTRSEDMLISRFNVDDFTSAGADYLVDVASLNLTASPLTGGAGGIEGIVVVPGKGIYLAGDGVNTANARSTYGRIDDQSGYIGDQFYTDKTHDDNDPILFLAVPEPASFVLLGLGVTAGSLLLRRRRG